MRRYKCNNCEERFFNRRRYKSHNCQSIEDYTVNELRAMAKEQGIEGIYNMNKQQLVETLRR